MKWDFKKNLLLNRKAFTLIEVSVALVILGMIAATVLVVVNRAIDTVVMWQTKMEAFEIVRENMEKLLAQKTVTDMVEYGIDANNPDINWETTVESFYEPVSSNMWMRAVCTAEFTDGSGEMQKIELTHWLTGLNKEQVSQIIEQQKREQEYMTITGNTTSGAITGTQQQAGNVIDQLLQRAEKLQQQSEQLQQQIEQLQQQPSGEKKQIEQKIKELQNQSEQLQHQAEQLQQQAERLQQRAEQSQQPSQDEQLLAEQAPNEQPALNDWLGAPPEGYNSWEDVPEQQFWTAVGNALSKNR